MSGELTFLGATSSTFAACIPNGKDTFTYRRKVYSLGWEVRGEGPRSLGDLLSDVEAFLAVLMKRPDMPYGAVSNNIEEYQREKLRLAGLQGFPAS